MPQSEMEALIQLQKETIESLRQLLDSQRLTIEQMSKSHEEQTAQMNQTIANLNETVEYLKKKLFASSSEKTKKDGFPGQMALFNEAEAAADPSIPEPTLEEAVGGYKRKAKKPKATREEILAGLPVVEVPCSVPDEERTALLQYSDGGHREKGRTGRTADHPRKSGTTPVCPGSAWLSGM